MGFKEGRRQAGGQLGSRGSHVQPEPCTVSPRAGKRVTREQERKQPFGLLYSVSAEPCGPLFGCFVEYFMGAPFVDFYPELSLIGFLTPFWQIIHFGGTVLLSWAGHLSHTCLGHLFVGCTELPGTPAAFTT